MRKFKKCLFLLLMLFLPLFLCSCFLDQANLEYTDRQGVKHSIKVEKTDNPEEVYNVLVALDEIEKAKEEEESKLKTISLEAILDLALNDGDGTEINMGLNAKAIISEEEDAYLKANFNMEQKMKSQGLSSNNKIDFKGELFLDDSGVYYDINFKNGENETKLKQTISLSEIEKLLEQLMGNLGSMDDLGSSFPEINIPEIENKEEFVKFLEQYGVVIADASRKSITFNMELSLNELVGEDVSGKIKISLELDHKKLAPLSIEVNGNDVIDALIPSTDTEKKPSGKIVFKLNFKYNEDKVKTLTDEQKKGFAPFDISNMLK